MLPSLIEILPLTSPVQAEINVPGSKSITNRALILAALSERTVTLKGALWSEDTQVMTEALRALGYSITVTPDPEEPCNRHLIIQGKGRNVPPGGAPGAPLEIFVGNAGTSARFLPPLLCLGRGVYRLHGVPRMHERPQSALFAALRQLGYRIDAPNNKLPCMIYGAGPRPARCSVSIEESSQFASGLLLCAKQGGWSVEVEGENADESAYVAMTSKLISGFPWVGGEFEIEPDASSASYFHGLSWLLARMPGAASSRISISHVPHTDWQVDSRFPGFFVPSTPAPSRLSRRTDLGDSIMTAVALGPFGHGTRKFEDLGKLRLQECERVVALRTELSKCDAAVTEQDDTLIIQDSTLRGAEIETYNDHRMAMCFGMLGAVVPGMRIRNPACVKKTFPNFFQKLAGPPPHGLGLRILDAASGRNLSLPELFAD